MTAKTTGKWIRSDLARLGIIEFGGPCDHSVRRCQRNETTSQASVAPAETTLAAATA